MRKFNQDSSVSACVDQQSTSSPGLPTSSCLGDSNCFHSVNKWFCLSLFWKQKVHPVRVEYVMIT